MNCVIVVRAVQFELDIRIIKTNKEKGELFHHPKASVQKKI